MKRTLLLWICPLAVASAFAPLTQAADSPVLSPTQAELYKRLTHELIAPCCWREPIAIHRSQESLQMLAEVEQLVAAGRSEEEVKALYVSQYGERILADPPGQEKTWLYYTPVLLFLTAVALAGWRLCSLVRSPAMPKHSVSPELLARIRKETES